MVPTLCFLVPCSNFKNWQLPDSFCTITPEKGATEEFLLHLPLPFFLFPQNILRETRTARWDHEKETNYASLHSFLIVTVSVLNKDCPLYSPKLRFQFGDYYSINEKVIGKIIFAYFQAGVFLTSYCQSVLLPIVVGNKAWSTQVLSRTGDPFSFPPFSFFHVLKLLWSFQRKNIDMATGC